MIPRDRSVGRQIEDIRQVITSVEFRGLKIQDGRDQDDPIEIHAVALLKVAGKACGARGAVAFASKELRRRPPLVARGIEPDKIRNGLDVWRYPMILLRRFAGNSAAIARRNGIDEDEVADVEKRHVVVDQLVRRRKKRARVAHLHAPRTEQAKMQPDG